MCHEKFFYKVKEKLNWFFGKYLSFMLRCVDSGKDDTWDNPSSALPNPFLTVSMLTPFVVLSGQHTNEESK